MYCAERNSKRHTELTQAVTEFTEKDMMPISTATGPGFMAMVTNMDKWYRPPSHTYFSQVAIPDLETKCRQRVAAELKTVELSAAATDLWSSCTKELHQSLTVHCLDKDFNLKARCIQASCYPVDHTSHSFVFFIVRFALEMNQILFMKKQTDLQVVCSKVYIRLKQ